MAVQSRAFYDLADTLYQKNPTSEEICCRSSINRAYYGAFHAAKIYLNFRDEDEVTHSFVIKQLTRKHRYLGDMLGSLFRIRKDADYKINLSFDQEDVKKALKKADIIIHALSST